MGLVSRVARWLRSLVGRESGPDAGEPASESAAAPPYRCSICGTGVRTPDGPCPLCGSTDLVVADEGAQDASGAESPADLDPEKVTRTAVSDGSAPEDRLRELARERGDPLRDHPDRWERLPERGQYAVDLPDGSTRYVDSRDEVRAVLREHDD